MVRTLAESDPASGSVRAKEVMVSPDAMPGSHLAFCSGVPNITSPWLPMPTLVPNTERKAGLARPSSKRDQALVFHGQAQAAVLLGDAEAEQAQRLHLLDQLWRDLVLLRGARLDRAQALGDEAADGVDQLVADLGVEGHGGPLPFRSGERRL